MKDCNRKRAKGILICVVASLAVLALQIWLWENQSMYFGECDKFLRYMGWYRSSEVSRLCSVCAYLSTLTPVLSAYTLTVLRPRRIGAEGYWTRNRLIAACGVIALSSFIGLLSVADIYQLVVPNAGVETSAAYYGYYAVFFLNTTVAAAMLIGAFVAEELSCAVKQRSRIFSASGLARSAARYGLVTATAALALVSSGLILNIVKVFNEDALSIISSFSLDNYTVSGLIVSVMMAPFVEEMMFRGLIFEKGKKYMPVWCAVIFSAVCFGIWHRNLGQFCYTVPMGILFAGVYYKTGRLRFSALAHFVNNMLNDLSMSTEASILPYVPILYRFRKNLLELSAPVSVALLAVTIAVMAVIVLKLLPRVSNPDGGIENRLSRSPDNAA